MTAHPGHVRWLELPPLDTQVLRHVVGHQQVNASYLVHQARLHGGVVATFDSRLTAHAQGGEVVVIPS
jgi:predicted nucleic acid-binding protein